jgi:hypothetical protein
MCKYGLVNNKPKISGVNEMETEEKHVCFVDGVAYKAQSDRNRGCIGCAGNNSLYTCRKLALCKGIIWVKAEPAPTAGATEVIDAGELRELWKTTYVAALPPSTLAPSYRAECAVASYKRAREQGIV